MREIEPDTCWMALAVCILTKKTPEMSINSLVEGPDCRMVGNDAPVEQLIELRKRHTYEEISKITGLSKDAIYRRIKRQKERDVVTYSYYCDHCQEVPLHLKGKDRCGKCGNEVRKVSETAKRVANDVKGLKITD
jgi:bacterioferritin-associated ferredoxin